MAGRDDSDGVVRHKSGPQIRTLFHESQLDGILEKPKKFTLYL